MIDEDVISFTIKSKVVHLRKQTNNQRWIWLKIHLMTKRFPSTFYLNIKERVHTKPIGLSVVPLQGSSFGDAHLASNASLNLSVAWHLKWTTRYQLVQYTCVICWYWPEKNEKNHKCDILSKKPQRKVTCQVRSNKRSL